MDEPQPNLTNLTVDLLAAYVSNNSVRKDDLVSLIQVTHAALSTTIAPSVAPEAALLEADVKPAVSARKSLASNDHIISMMDGKPYRTLKRHLASHGLSPASYRERYKLPASYPMVAPSYSDLRRDVATRSGLGNRK